jgi:hypothetical protein
MGSKISAAVIAAKAITYYQSARERWEIDYTL